MPSIPLTMENLQPTIDDNSIVLVDFWSKSCGPCMTFKPVFEAASDKHPDVKFATCDTDEQDEIAAGFGIQAVPTLAIFRDQILVFMEAGALPPEVLEDVITQVQGLDMEEVRQKLAEEESSCGCQECHQGCAEEVACEEKKDCKG
jgi:thioredoxin 1